ncbi:GNAT family N-acetyltransferase [Kushneria phosphatilytica]|uniref:GNAT family N-acetyltransferase n=1 Tax=Kushneria phosphatilytica TaxID=657387 RepID=A0A1S1NQK4_9GAMM|nr:GNAT family N-acetyltransferase [Kushneria phosphatilytica]OHV10899.1 hypothetical protein BH688_08395 [Kushneria phosphatilytica]QEL12015.1 GNAT family N-acetyltransferase [Kushneria phosphatilytica]
MTPVALGPAQAVAMAALDRRVRMDPWSEAVYHALAMRQEAELWGIMSDAGELIAMMVLAFGPWDIELELIGVDVDWRRRGLGECLLALARERLETTRRERLLLEVRHSNQPARALYERHGFRIDGRRRAYYEAPAPGGQREDAILMSLTLAAPHSPL